MDIGKRIKKLRKENGFTQAELGQLINKSMQVISNWERGYTGIDKEDIQSLATALKTSSDYLLCLTDNPKYPNEISVNETTDPVADPEFLKFWKKIKDLPPEKRKAIEILLGTDDQSAAAEGK